MLGIFQVHQFEKVEQLCVTSPFDNDSWKMHEEMLKNSGDLYQQVSYSLCHLSSSLKPRLFLVQICDPFMSNLVS